MTDTDAVLKAVMEGGGLLNPEYNKEGRQSPIQQTLAIIKPDAMDKSEEIINVIKKEGFAVLQTRKVQLTAEQAASFYQDAYQTELFSESVTYLSSGPILTLVLSGPLAVQHLTEFFGPAKWLERSQVPKSLRFIYGKMGSDYENALHASETEEDALRELHFFFPEVIMEPILTGDNIAATYLNNFVHPTLTLGLSKLCREKPEDPVMWLADWLLANNPNKPKELNSPNGGCM